MCDTLIRVNAASKKFCRDLKTSLAYGLRDMAGDLAGSRGRGRQHLRRDEFWAVDEISFSLQRGQCLGLIGPNGSGKSTLLKMVNGILKPDRGTIEIKGRVSALIELGAGFNPILTGKENIYVNGAILGMEKSEIDSKLDQIIEFSGVHDAIDTPIRSFSSGMRVRLGFAIAAHVDTDVLLIDEVLAVGDVGFKQKCFNTMAEMSPDRAIVFVSHNMANIARLSTSVLVMNTGREVIQTEDVGRGIQEYFEQFPTISGTRIGDDLVRLEFCRVVGTAEDVPTVRHGEELLLELEFSVVGERHPNVLHLKFVDKEAKEVAIAYTRIPSKTFGKDERGRLRVKIPDLPLSAGRYGLSLLFAESFNNTVNGKIIAHYDSAISLRVVGSETISNIPVQLAAEVETDAPQAEPFGSESL